MLSLPLFFFLSLQSTSRGGSFKITGGFLFPLSIQSDYFTRQVLYSGLRPYNPRPPKDTYRLYLRLPPPPPSVTNLKFLLPRRSHALYFLTKVILPLPSFISCFPCPGPAFLHSWRGEGYPSCSGELVRLRAFAVRSRPRLLQSFAPTIRPLTAFLSFSLGYISLALVFLQGLMAAHIAWNC